MAKNENLFLKKEDFMKISAMLTSAPAEVRNLLQEELDRATVVEVEEFPAEAVSMHSTVKYRDVDSAATTEIVLVYPHEASVESNKISIFAPIGAALIGLKVGQQIAWPLPHGKEKLIEVVQVTQNSK